MVWHPTKDAVKRLWGRRWVRRISYAVVAGATLFSAGPWLLTRPPLLRWAMGHLDTWAREETGLPLVIGRVEVHPALGYLVLHDLRLGGDLLTVQRIEIQADLWSLMGPTHHIRALRVEQPHLRLTEAGLAGLRLRSHPPRQGPLPQFQLDLFSLTGGQVQVPEPLRGLPALQYQFSTKGTGLGANHLRVDLAGAQLAVKGPQGWERGRLDLSGDLSEAALRLDEVYLRLGESQLRLSGRYQAASPGAQEQVEAKLGGVLDLSQAAHWGGSPRSPLSGTLDLAGSLQGTLARPTWTFAAEGQNLQPAQAAFLPGSLDLKGGGEWGKARLDHLHWSSPQGDLDFQGKWSQAAPAQGEVRGTNLDLEALGRAFHLTEFQGARATLQGQVRGPGPGEALTRLDRWQASLKAALTQHGAEAGALELSLDRGRATLSHLKLDLETLKAEGTGWATLGARDLTQVVWEGKAVVGADQVARALRAWGVTSLDMEGQTSAQASLRWTPRAGLDLEGSCSVAQPRWHGARADSLQAKVQIRGTELRVQDIDLRKDLGRGGGDLWLTWGRTPPGQPQIDMCFTALGLPVAEGLRAADLKTPEGGDLPLEGSASGWVRILGPYAALTMNGAVQLEAGEAYGIKVPAASSDFWMDLEAAHLRLSDTRIAERPDLLGRGDLPPEGALALSGMADMDFRNWTWRVDLGGRLDSQLLAIPGPRLQAQVEARLLGPITSPFGGPDLPEGRISLARGRIFFGDRSLEGLTGRVSLERGRLEGRLGIEGMASPLLDLQVHREGPDLAGTLALAISPESARTDLLAKGLTNDLLEDLSLSARLQGRWTQGRNLVWSGSLDRLAAQFGAFELHQAHPSALQGDARGAALEVALEGGSRGPAAQTAIQAAHVQLSGLLPFSSAAPLTLRAQGEADLAHMKAILDRVMEVDEYSLLSELRVQGTSQFDIQAHGTYFDPLLDGTISLHKGQMNLRGYQGAEDVQAEVVLKDRTLTVSEERPVQGTLAHGALRASGVATWRPGGLDAYTIKATLANFQLRDVPEGLDLQGTLQATLAGNEEGGLLRGRLQADRLSYHSEIKLTDLILRSALTDTGGLTGLDPDDPLERIRLDLDLDLRSPWSFDTNLLKLEGRPEGPFQVLGTLGHPVPKGIMLFQPGGRITNVVPAGDLVVERGGTLTFSEARPLDPAINLQGSVSSIPGYTVVLDIRGTLSNLSIVPSSTPSLRQDEIVSILINPGNVANVGTAGASSGATQNAITSGLASASSGLVSTLALANLQEQLRRALGLDRVNVAVRTTSLGTTETEFTLGKSLSLLGQRSAFVISHKKSGDVSVTSGQMEWRFGDFILQLGGSKGGEAGLSPSGEIRHTWSPK